MIGGKTDEHHGAPIPFSGRVVNLTDGGFELELKSSHLASMLGTHAEMGPCAVIENEQAKILLSSRKMPPMVPKARPCSQRVPHNGAITAAMSSGRASVVKSISKSSPGSRPNTASRTAPPTA